MLGSLATSTLMTLSLLLGVEAIPSQVRPEWLIKNEWHPITSGYQLEATSTSIIENCKNSLEQVIQFPTIVHGAHEVFLDNRKILTFGDPTFSTLRSFYGAPHINCAEVRDGSTLTWRATSYAKYFSRFSEFPSIQESPPKLNVFSESLNIIAAGSLLLMALVSIIIFYGKVSNGFALSIFGSNLFLSIYFIFSVSGLLGIKESMLTAHKIADLGLWAGIVTFFNALRLHGLFSVRVYALLLVNAALGILIISFAKSGDQIQFGTTLPFVLGLSILLHCLYIITLGIFKTGFKRKDFLIFLSLGAFIVLACNDILVITGVIQGFMLLSLGFVGALVFLTLSVNEAIDQTYVERDYLRTNLEQEVEAKTNELRLRNGELQETLLKLQRTQADLLQSEKLAALGTLSAGIAHEINNSLNYVSGGLRQIKKIGDSLENEEKRIKMAKLTSIASEGLDLTFEIIKSLRNYTGLNQAKFTDLGFRDLIQSVLVLFKGKIGDGITIDVDVPDSTRFYGNVVGMNQVFMNLITNAVDAMNGRGKLTISAASNDSSVIIKVSDTGSGIPESIRTRIFDPFFTTKEVGKGTGLGLHIIKSEIDKHSGKIKIESEVGTGTTFLIELPIASPTEVEVAA